MRAICSLMVFFLSTLFCTEVCEAQQKRRRPQLSPSITTTLDVEYIVGGHERQRLDLYVPQANGKGKPALVVWVHGGGWAKGSKSGIGNCAWVLDEGYALASIGYRLTDAAVFPAQLDDCRAGLTWLRDHADKYGYDATKIVVWGSSAGGHLVSMLGTTGDPDESSDDLAGVIDWFGPTDLLTMQKQRTLPVDLNADAPDSFESKLVGGPLQEVPGKAKAASPVSHVTSDDTPFLIMHGDQDALVSLSQSKTLHAKLKAVGVDSQMHVIEGAGHGGPLFQSDSSRDLIRQFLHVNLHD